jgi:NAD(P)H dehydrogenase (quinone)
MSIVVTGSTGGLGGRVARRLADAGIEQTLLVRDASRAPELPRARVVQAAYADTDAVRGALEGADAVFMVSASESVNRRAEHASFITAARDAAVGHLVYTSFVGASEHATFTLARDHWAAEQLLVASGLPVTALRDNLYADFLPFMVGEDGVIRGPAGTGHAAVVARDDIADVATLILREPIRHVGKTYDLTGPDSLSFGDIAAQLSAVQGREISYYAETIEEAYASRAKYGAPDWQLDAWVSTYTAVANGELDVVSPMIPDLLGRPATSLRELLQRV